jgi:hypothetical protein
MEFHNDDLTIFLVCVINIRLLHRGNALDDYPKLDWVFGRLAAGRDAASASTST